MNRIKLTIMFGIDIRHDIFYVYEWLFGVVGRRGGIIN